ncbi:glycosyltransferase family A protein, partial [Azospirillum sp. sgz301742]
FLFLQDADDLFLAEPAALHRSVSVDGGLYPNLEEFSGRRSEELARANPQIMLLRNENNQGPSQCRNPGATHTDAELLFFLDGDDAFCEPHVHLCLALMEKFPNTGMVKTGIVLANPIDSYWYASLVQSLPMNICIRAACHSFIGGFDERLRVTEDAAYCHMIETFFSSVYVDTPTVRYNRYPGNALDRQYAKFAKPPGQGPHIPAVPPNLKDELPPSVPMKVRHQPP